MRMSRTTKEMIVFVLQYILKIEPGAILNKLLFDIMFGHNDTAFLGILF